MKTFFRRYLTILFALTVAGSAGAQQFANNLAAASTDPVADSIAISRMREKLEHIRQTEHRPTVALVLSGGGAKGASYIGILRYMEEIGIPIDMICGTSMGGLVGGMYALGYSSSDLEHIFKSVDWEVTMSDDIDMKFVPFEEKSYKDKVSMTLPFYYDDETHQKRNQILNQPIDDDMESSASKKRMLSTLPMGYINGFNIETMLSNLTVGYHGDIMFDELPIPFFCVSSDLVSAKANYHTHGSLTKALRATMSIPGVFAPVRMGSMILIDGGTRNNFPVDIARAMGADIIIGAEAAKRGTTYSDVNSALDILSCMITMLGDDARSNKVAQPDMFLKPETGNLKTLSFNPEAISELIGYGYESAKAKSGDFAAIKARLGSYELPDSLNHDKALNLFENKVLVSGIMANGIEKSEQTMFRRILALKGHRELDAADIKNAMSRVMATGAYEKVNYSLLWNESSNDYTLEFDCVPGQIHSFGIGLRMDTEEMAELLLDLRLNAHNLKGWQFDFQAKISSQQSVKALASYISDNFAQVNFSADFKRVRADVMTPIKNLNYDLTFFDVNQTISVSNFHSRFVCVEAGLRHENLWIPDGSPMFSDYREDMPVVLFDFRRKAHYLTGFGRVDINTMDDRQFPTRGFKGGVNVDYDFTDFEISGCKPVWMIDFSSKFVIPCTKWFAIVPQLYYRAYNNDEAVEGSDYTFFHSNYIGGALQGRYMKQQIPFVGFGDVIHVQNHVFVTNVDFRFNVLPKLYVSGLGGFYRTDYTLADMFDRFSPDVFGWGVEVAYKSFIGPIKLNAYWNDADFCKNFGLYFSLGYDF